MFLFINLSEIVLGHKSNKIISDIHDTVIIVVEVVRPNEDSIGNIDIQQNYNVQGFIEVSYGYLILDNNINRNISKV